MKNPEQLVVVHVSGLTYSFSHADHESMSIYGGPLESAVSGCKFGPARLHQVASLSPSNLPILGDAPWFVVELPLVYGFRFDGCSLEYRFEILRARAWFLSAICQKEGCSPTTCADSQCESYLRRADRLPAGCRFTLKLRAPTAAQSKR
jgi:hypothetical protein